MDRADGTAGRPCRPLAVLPLPPRRHRRGVRPGAPTASRVPAWRSPRPTRLGLDLTASWVVGDSDCDIGLARAVGPGRCGSALSRDGRRPRGPRPGRRRRPHPGRARGTIREAGSSFPQLTLRVGVHVRRLRRGAPGAGHGRRGRLAEPPICWSPRPERDGLRLRQRRVRLDREPSPVRPRQGVRIGTDLTPGSSASHERRAVQRDRQRHRLRRRLRVPARVDGPSRRRAGRGLVVRPVTEHRPRPEVGRRERHADHRHDRFRRRRQPARSPVSRSMCATTTEPSKTRTRPACTCWPSTPDSRGWRPMSWPRRSSEGMRVAINLLTDDPAHPSGAHWFWTRVIPEMAVRLATTRSCTCW